MEYTNTSETMEINSHGPHQLAFVRKSVKVFEGAMKVLMMRAPSESEDGPGAGTDTDKGGSGSAAMSKPPTKPENPRTLKKEYRKDDAKEF
jgi:hypothetical protein